MSEQRGWSILQVLDWTVERFTREGIESPRLDAEVLLAHCLNVPRIRLYTDYDKPLAPVELACYRTFVKRRLAREPVAYIQGKREFWSLDFEVDPAVLVPRPETELLVQLALDHLRDLDGRTIVDVGTGSGAIAVALASELGQHRLHATELDEAALAVARRNAARHGVTVAFFQGDLLTPLPTELELDLVVSNLPYIPSGELDGLAAEITRWEPRQALDGGRDGLAVIQRLVQQAQQQIVRGGGLLLEIGSDQGEAVESLLQRHGFEHVRIHRDLAGCDRVVSARR